MVVFGKVVVLGKNWFNLGKGGCILARWLYSDKVVVLGQNWLYSDEVVVIGKVVVFGQKFLCSRKSGCIRAK